MAKKILDSQLNYIVHKSNLERAQKELARLKRTPGTTDEALATAKNRVELLREKSKAAVDRINILGDSKSSIG
jgi:hypothetical protein